MAEILRQVKLFERFNILSFMAVPVVLFAGIGLGFLIFGGGTGKETSEPALQMPDIAMDDTITTPKVETGMINTQSTVITSVKNVEDTKDTQKLIDSLYNGAVDEARNIILGQKDDVTAAQDAGFEELQTAMRELNDSLNKISNDLSDRLRKVGIPEYQIADLEKTLYNKITDLEEEVGL